jgi:hypothetical protein
MPHLFPEGLIKNRTVSSGKIERPWYTFADDRSDIPG